MHSDKHYAAFQARIANSTLSYSPEVSAALYAHARQARAGEMGGLMGRVLSALKARLSTGSTKTFAKTPAVATR